jgi:mevalonate kinase
MRCGAASGNPNPETPRPRQPSLYFGARPRSDRNASIEAVETGAQPFATRIDALLSEGRAPAKTILLGEHSVVYGQPAIAVPIRDYEACATVVEHDGPMRLVAHFPSEEDRAPIQFDLLDAPDESHLATAARAALSHAGRTDHTPWLLELTSTIPTGRGLGSSAAVSVAIVRAIGMAAQEEWDDETVSELALQAERRAHGRPSGIDNMVVALARPIVFEAGHGESFDVGRDLRLVVADSGSRSSTSEMVAGVRDRREARPTTYADWFSQIGDGVDQALTALSRGNASRLGRLMGQNHLILQAMRVSTPQLDGLVAAACGAGALGAKLCGSGGGGAIIALVDPDGPEGAEEALSRALRDAGAGQVFATTIEASAEAG